MYNAPTRLGAPHQKETTTMPASTLAKLGHPDTAKLLIINGDDIGASHAANIATIDAMEHGIMTATSLMVPCPWAFDACHYLHTHPQADAGVHLTLNAEWPTFKWGPVLGAKAVPSLVDGTGFFYQRPSAGTVQHGRREEVLAELDAQIQRAISWGVVPTKLDNHMGPMHASEMLTGVYIELARKYNLPIRIMAGPKARGRVGGMLRYAPEPEELEGILYIDDMRGIGLSDVPLLKGQLLQSLRSLNPGVTELVLHAAAGTPEARDMMDDWEARAEAYRLVTHDSEIKDEIAKQSITLIGWRHLREAQRAH